MSKTTDDDDRSSEVKKRWACTEGTDTDDMSPNAVYDDISGQQFDGTLVREARMNELEGLGNLCVNATITRQCHSNPRPTCSQTETSVSVTKECHSSLNC